MDKAFYHLQTEPFGAHPNTDTFFVSDTHQEAWHYLLFGIDTHEPLLVLTGDYGMGKTLLCLRLIKVLKEKGIPWVEYIPTSTEGFGGILRRIASRLGISPVPEDERILREMIYDRFRADTDNSRFYLIIDDAHELDTTTLAKLRYLTTFNHNEFFLMTIIFVGHPSFLQALRTPALSSLNQRIKRRYPLGRFSFEETKNYIYFRLLKSGATGIPAFPDEAMQKVFEYSGGIPRLINNICDTCLLIGAAKKLISIHPAVVDEAKNLIEGSLTSNEAEVRTDSDATDEAGASITFSADLPAGDAAKQHSIFSTRTDTEEYQLAMFRPPVAVFGKKRRNVVTMAVAAILLMLSGAILSQLFMNDNKIFTFFSPTTPTAWQNTPLQPEKTAVETPTLRKELEKPYTETPALTTRTDAMTSAPTDIPPKQASGMDTQTSSTPRTRGVSGGSP